MHYKQKASLNRKIFNGQVPGPLTCNMLSPRLMTELGACLGVSVCAKKGIPKSMGASFCADAALIGQKLAEGPSHTQRQQFHAFPPAPDEKSGDGNKQELRNR